MKPVEVLGVRVESPSNTPLVLLQERDGARCVPIWIGAAEATAIAYAQQGVEPPRPLTHDLMLSIVEVLGSRVEQVRVTGLRDGVYFAEIVFAGGQIVSARPSDAIALALRASCPLAVDEAVLDEVGVVIGEPAEDEVERFKEFLDQVSPEDFGDSGDGPT